MTKISTRKQQANGGDAVDKSPDIEIYTEADLNRKFGLSHNWLYRMQRKGKFPPCRILSANRRYWLKSEVTAFFQNQPIGINPSPTAK